MKSNFSSLFNNYKTAILGIVSALCLVVIILGSVAAYDISKEFMTSSEVYGKPVITHLEGDEYDLELNEDESIFFAYTFSNLTFTQAGQNWSDIKTIEKLDYRPNERDYALYINGVNVQTNKLTRNIVSPVSLIFRNPNDSVTTVEFKLEFRFFTERTDILIHFTSDRYIGYINQMVNKGFNIRLIEKPISDEFGNAGDVNTSEPVKNTYTYNFNPSALQWDNDLSHLPSAPYYVYADTLDPTYGKIITAVATSTRRNYFCGVIYHDGFTTANMLKGGVSDITQVNPTIEISGITEGGSYDVYIAFDDGKTDSVVMAYMQENRASSGILTALPGLQSKYESTTYDCFYDSFNKERNPNVEGNWTSGTSGAIERTIETSYGVYDVLINPSFATKDGQHWVFSCGIYLKNPLSAKMDSAIVAAVESAMRTQLGFSMTISY